MGNGMNYIREIMSMNLPDTPVEKFAGSYNFIGHIQDGYKVALTSPFVAIAEDNWASDTNYVRKRKATAGDVIAYEHELYAWCTEMGDRGLYPYGGIWLKFIPGPCTQYTGPIYAYPRTNYDGPIPKKEEKGAMEYHKIPYGFMKIKNVVFNYPATIVMWEDGSKTVVKCGENEDFDPEKGLTMAIAKKAFGNQGNYYNQIRKWLPMDEPVPTVHVDSNSISETIGRINTHISNVAENLNRVFADPKVERAKNYLKATQELIVNMTYKGATKTELVRVIKYSKDLIDASKGADVDIDESAKVYGIVELSKKYQLK